MVGARVALAGPVSLDPHAPRHQPRHRRARHEQVVEVDCPGLTSPILSRFAWKHLPRPVMPIYAEARWP